MTSDHDRMEDAVAACVLNACDQEEEEQVRAHIVACPSCRALARRLSQAADALPLAADEARPPDRLRARILAAAAAQPPAQGTAPAPPARILRLPRSGLDPGPGGRRWSRLRVPARWAVVAGVAAALVALAAWNVVLNQQLDTPPAHYPLVGTGTLAGAAGTVTASQRQAVVSLTGMPQPPPDRVYELWLIDANGRAIPGGVFTPTAAGTAVVGVNRPLNDIRVVAVTQETGPAGAQAPTQKPELAGQVG